MKNSVIHEKLNDLTWEWVLFSRKLDDSENSVILKNSVIHEKLADDFLVERNRAEIL